MQLKTTLLAGSIAAALALGGYATAAPLAPAPLKAPTQVEEVQAKAKTSARRHHRKYRYARRYHHRYYGPPPYAYGYGPYYGYPGYYHRGPWFGGPGFGFGFGW
jgi:hypothetical protein